jgi:hypothetical protein
VTVRELIERLEDFDGGEEVRLAFQPPYPLETGVGGVEAASVYQEGEEAEEVVVVWIGAGGPEGYLPGSGARALGWR